MLAHPLPSLASLESDDDRYVAAQRRLAHLRAQAAVVRTLSDHVERFARPEDIDGVAVTPDVQPPSVRLQAAVVRALADQIGRVAQGDEAKAVSRQLEEERARLEAESSRPQNRVGLQPLADDRRSSFPLLRDQGDRFNVAIDLGLPGHEILVGHAPSDEQGPASAYAVIDRAFDDAHPRGQEAPTLGMAGASGRGA